MLSLGGELQTQIEAGMALRWWSCVVLKAWNTAVNQESVSQR